MEHSLRQRRAPCSPCIPLPPLGAPRPSNGGAELRLLPSAWRRALPQYGNEVVGMMHATAIASTVTLVDVTRVARDVYANHLLPAEAFGTAMISW